MRSNVNGFISDIFFNADLDRARDEINNNDPGADNPILRELATETIERLDGLGVSVPTEDELVADFFERL